MLLRIPLVATAVLFFTGVARANLTLPAIVSDGMVLQEKAPVHIWGWGAEGEKVKVTFRGQSAVAETRDGRWSVTLPPLEPGGPFTMTIAGSNTVTVNDVLVGEVWVCSGQSNMEFALARSFEAKTDIEAPPDSKLRTFTVGRKVADAPQSDVSGGAWESATAQARGRFSAVGYYFGRALRQARGVPVGLIHASWGGTPAEAWTSQSALEAWGMPASSFRGMAPVSKKDKEEYEKSLAAWKAAGRPQGTFDDPGVSETAKSWSSPRLDARDWSAMPLPGPWEQLGGPSMQIDGAVWFRKEIDLPPRWAGKDLDLALGAIDDFDTTFFDGFRVGTTGAENSHHWESPRRYRIPASAVHAGPAVVAVRVWDHGGAGGLTGPAGAMWIGPADAAAGERQSLAGDWRFKVELGRPSMPIGPPGADPNLPSVLYNGMIAPIVPYTIQGATWYQGESNAGRASQYRGLLSAMIKNWRGAWGAGDFPFLIVQLAPFMAIKTEPEESDWAKLREAQSQVARDLPNVGVAVITDVGDENDIHPTKKGPVGERLALAARKIAYKENVVAFGPTFRSVAITGGKATIAFDNVGKGLEVRGDRLTGFAIAGADKAFVFADAALAGDRVVVSSPKVPSPMYVRFGWANYPVVNLWNKDGLPASPFRTDPP
jgi:sialate O-acetylesterase